LALAAGSGQAEYLQRYLADPLSLVGPRGEGGAPGMDDGVAGLVDIGIADDPARLTLRSLLMETASLLGDSDVFAPVVGRSDLAQLDRLDDLSGPSAVWSLAAPSVDWRGQGSPAGTAGAGDAALGPSRDADDPASSAAVKSADAQRADITGVATASPLSQASTAWLNGDVKAAAALLEVLVDKEPDLAEVQVLLGKVYLDLAEGAAAEQAFRAAGALGLADARVLPLLSQAMLQQGAFLRLLDEVPIAAGLPAALRSELWVARGQALLSLGAEQGATDAFERAAELAPDEPLPLLGRAELAIAAGRLDDGEALLTLALGTAPNHPALLHARGELAERGGQLQDAVLWYTRAVREGRFPWRSHYRRALVKGQLGDVDSALLDIKRVRALFGEFPRLRLLEGALLAKGGDQSGALAAFQEYLALAPTDGTALRLAAKSLYRLDRYEEAAAYLTRFLQREPESLKGAVLMARVKVQQGDHAAAEAVLAPLHSALHAPPEVAVALAAALAGQQRFEEALGVVARALAVAPWRPDLRAARLQLQMRAGAAAGAESELRALMDEHGADQPLQLALVAVLAMSGELDQAMAEARRAVASDPESALALAALGTALQVAGQGAQARVALRQALILNPSQQTATLGLAAWDRARGNKDEARQRYREVLARDPDNVGVMLALAGMDDAVETVTDIPAVLAEELERNPRNLALRTLLATLYLDSGDASAALAVLEPLPAQQTADATIMRLRVRAALANGEASRAVEAAEELLAMTPDRAADRYLLSIAHSRAGEVAAARHSYAYAGRLDPGHPLRLEALDLLRGLLPPTELDELTNEAVGKAGTGLRAQAMSALHKGDYAAAIGLYRRLAAEDPDAPDAVRGLLAGWIGAGNAAEARRIAEAWLEAHPDDVQLLVLSAELSMHDGDRPTTEKHLRRALNLEPQHHLVLNNLAAVLTADDPTQAIVFARRAVELQPLDGHYLHTLGEALLEADDAAQAAQVLADAWSKRPGSASVAYHYAAALARVGEDERAADILRSILDRDFAERPSARALLSEIGGAGPQRSLQK
jgi:putative PEP-CTERM system TPR-repeat lipoprotein